MTPEQVAHLISQGLPGARVEVRSDDHVHFTARVVYADFAGKRPIARHQLVYGTLGELMGREIHAMSLEVFTPDELSDAKNR
jgi:acid stress-induced BolA-like protein IbaG/YrbA